MTHIPLLSHNTPLPLKGTYFITGTDTEVGKTTTTQQLIRALAKQGKACYAIKPVTAGTDAWGESDDAKRINQFASLRPTLSAIAPIVLQTPCSPHIASNIESIDLQINTIVETIQQTLNNYPADCVLVEGAGGWCTPINADETLAAVAIALDLPIILVVGIKLGCLNHAVLTLQAIWQAGGEVAMVIYNQLAEHTAFEEQQIDWLNNYIRQALAKKNTAKSSYPLMCIQPFLSDNKVL